MCATIIIPIKNQFEYVKKCLISIDHNYPDYEIVIVDDGSDEPKLLEYFEHVKSKKNKWIFIRNENSKGHSIACTLGIQKSTQENIYLLNSDTILLKNSLSVLNKILNENKEIGVVGPSTSSASGPQLIQSFYKNRFKMSIEDMENYSNKIFDKFQYAFQEIKLVNGFCLGIKRTVFNKVGGFDPNLKCYGNEKELLIRIRNNGYKTVWGKGSYVHHFGKISYSKIKLNIGKAQIDADKYIFKKHGRLE